MSTNLAKYASITIPNRANIILKRNDLKISQVKFAELTGIKHTRISKFERGIIGLDNFSLREIIEINRVLFPEFNTDIEYYDEDFKK